MPSDLQRCTFWGGSSAGQSSGLIIRRSWVRAPPAPPPPKSQPHHSDRAHCARTAFSGRDNGNETSDLSARRLAVSALADGGAFRYARTGPIPDGRHIASWQQDGISPAPVPMTLRVIPSDGTGGRVVLRRRQQPVLADPGHAPVRWAPVP